MALDGRRHGDDEPARTAAPSAASRCRRDDSTMQMMEPQPRPVEGRSLRNAGDEARLGADA